jgi:hypothetical protein
MGDADRPQWQLDAPDVLDLLAFDGAIASFVSANCIKDYFSWMVSIGYSFGNSGQASRSV